MRFSLFRKSIFINRRGCEMQFMAHGAAYHTTGAMNQNIVWSAQDTSGHAQGKSDLKPRRQTPVQLEQYPARGDIPGYRGHVPVGSCQHYGQTKRKSHRAPHFLPGKRGF
jgi:hypothetical protein